MGVDRGLGHPGLAGTGQDVRQEFVARQPLAELGPEDVLEAIGLGQQPPQARGRLGLARPQHVSPVLVVAREPQVPDAAVGMDQVAGPDGAVVGPELLLQRVAADPVEERLERYRQAQVGRTLPVLPLEVLGRRLAGHDGLAAVAVGHDSAGHRHDLLVEADLLVREGGQPPRGHRLGRGQPLHVLGRQGLRQLLIEVVRQAPRGPLDAADVDADPPRVALRHDLRQERPLLLVVAPLPRLLEEARRVGHRDAQALDAPRRPAVVEHQHLKDGAPRVHRHHRGEHRVEVVLLAEDHPHVEARLAHGQGQDGRQTLLEDLADDPGLFPHGQDPSPAPALPARPGCPHCRPPYRRAAGR